MRKQLAGTLALVVALAGLPVANRTQPSLAQMRADAAPAAQPAALARGAVGESIVRKGAPITRLVDASVAVPVPGYADIFLAGRIYPFTLSGSFGVDVAERDGPPRVAIAVPAGHAISVVGRFATADGFSAPKAPDANGFTSRVILAGPAQRGIGPLGLSSVRAPVDALVGVFTGSRPNSGKAPATLNFSTAAARDAATLKPALNQVFFIGTGVTSRGITKRFIVPHGAASLYLGSLDYAGSNHDNHGTILAVVTGAQVVAVRVAPGPTATPTTAHRRPVASPTPTPRVAGTATPIPLIGMLLPTDTATGTPTATPTLVVPSGFQVNAQGQIVTAQGTPVTLNAQGTPVNAQGTPVNPQGQPLNPQGTPVNTQGTPVNAQNTPLPTSTPIPTYTLVPGAPTLTPVTVSPTPSITVTPIPTPIVQSVTESWSQYQFDYQHNGYQEQDTKNAQAGNALDLDPNADPLSPFYAGKLHQQTASPAISGDVSVAGGPVLGLNGLYFSTGQDASLRCVWANGSPGGGFGCPAGFTRISFGSNFEDDVPVINPTSPSENIVYYLSHNNPTGKTIGGQTGSLTAYNANTGGAVASYSGSAVLPTAPGVALTVYNNTCYVPTLDGMLHFLSCGPNGTGQDTMAPVALGGTPLAGASIDPADKLVLVAVQNKSGTGGSLLAFGDAESATPGVQAWTAALPQGATAPPQSNGTVYTPFQPIVFPPATPTEVVVATNYGIAAYSLPGGSQLWSRTGSVTGTTSSGGNGPCGAADRVPNGYTVAFNAEDTPAYDPFPTGSDVPSVYVGLPISASGAQIANDLVRLNAQTGAVCAVGTGAPSGAGIPIAGAPITTTGAPTTSLLNPLVTGRDVVFYADAGGAVYALDGSTLAPLVSAGNHAYPDLARPAISGQVPPNPANPNAPFSPPIGASLIVANGHLYFGNGAGTIFNYSY